jgi:transposase
VRHSNTVLHSILANMPWRLFDREVEAHQADKRVRRLSTKTQFTALLYGQLSGALSLRALVDSFRSHARCLYHLGVKPVARSSISDANAQRPSAVFSALFAGLVARVHPRLAREIGDCILLLDSSTCPLNNRSADWAQFSTGVSGVKMHVVYDATADCPIYAAITPQRINDISAAQAMPIQAGATYVFDLGYYDYAWWAALDAAGCRIVTRFKSNTRLTLATERLMPPGGIVTPNATILADRTGYLPTRLTHTRRNPMNHLVREVTVRIETGKVLRILTNDLQSSAVQIAELYKRRWAIELFFRWVKQTLRIRRFMGTSENAVCIQIAVALIAFLLLRLAQRVAGLDKESPLQFARLVTANLMHRKTLRQLFGAKADPPPLDPRQAALQWG